LSSSNANPNGRGVADFAETAGPVVPSGLTLKDEIRPGGGPPGPTPASSVTTTWSPVLSNPIWRAPPEGNTMFCPWAAIGLLEFGIWVSLPVDV
jgi:hypothetical protein